MGPEQPSQDRAHRIERDEAEQALLNEPVPMYQQDVEGESRVVYYGETIAVRLLALVVTERGGNLRVITAYDLDAGAETRLLRETGAGRVNR